MHDLNGYCSEHGPWDDLVMQLAIVPSVPVMNGMLISIMCILLLMWMLGEKGASRLSRRLFFFSLIGLIIQNYCFLVRVCGQVFLIF